MQLSSERICKMYIWKQSSFRHTAIAADRWVFIFFLHSIRSIRWRFCSKLFFVFFSERRTTCIISSKAMALPSIVRIIHVQWHIKCCCCFFCIECARLWHIKCAHAMQSIRLYSMCIRFQYLPSINKSQFLLQFNSAVDILSLMLSLFYRQLHTPAWFN